MTIKQETAATEQKAAERNIYETLKALQDKINLEYGGTTSINIHIMYLDDVQETADRFVTSEGFSGYGKHPGASDGVIRLLETESEGSDELNLVLYEIYQNGRENELKEG